MSKTGHGESCNHPSATTAFHQTIDELEFERGIWSAAINGDIERLQTLINRDAANVNKPDNHGYTALHYASRAGNSAVCTVLLESGADVNAKLRSGDTALHRASYMGRENVVRLLIKHKADACAGADGHSPLHKAVQQRRLDVAKLLIDRFPQLLNMADSSNRLPSELYVRGYDNDLDWRSLLGISDGT